jgi:hypothetical protein
MNAQSSCSELRQDSRQTEDLSAASLLRLRCDKPHGANVSEIPREESPVLSGRDMLCNSAPHNCVLETRLSSMSEERRGSRASTPFSWRSAGIEQFVTRPSSGAVPRLDGRISRPDGLNAQTYRVSRRHQGGLTKSFGSPLRFGPCEKARLLRAAKWHHVGAVYPRDKGGARRCGGICLCCLICDILHQQWGSSLVRNRRPECAA